jgi:hypothetical protein
MFSWDETRTQKTKRRVTDMICARDAHEWGRGTRARASKGPIHKAEQSNHTFMTEQPSLLGHSIGGGNPGHAVDRHHVCPKSRKPAAKQVVISAFRSSATPKNGLCRNRIKSSSRRLAQLVCDFAAGNLVIDFILTYQPFNGVCYFDSTGKILSDIIFDRGRC